jgi:hypothetical protein
VNKVLDSSSPPPKSTEKRYRSRSNEISSTGNNPYIISYTTGFMFIQMILSWKRMEMQKEFIENCLAPM